MMIFNLAGGDPLQPSVSRIHGCVLIGHQTKPDTPRCVSPQTSWKLTSSRRKKNETWSTLSCRVLSSSKTMMPPLPSKKKKKKIGRIFLNQQLLWNNMQPFTFYFSCVVTFKIILLSFDYKNVMRLNEFPSCTCLLVCTWECGEFLFALVSMETDQG